MKRTALYLIFVLGFMFSNSQSSWTYGGIIRQYTENSRPGLALGINYSLSNKIYAFPDRHRSVFGNAVDAYLEFFATSFFSFYFGYQYMNYIWEEKTGRDYLASQKALQGMRIYLGGFFIHGGVHEIWLSKDSSANIFTIGPYVGLGYSSMVLRDLLEIETGSRFYFYPNDKDRHKLSMGYYNWDWYIGLKFHIL